MDSQGRKRSVASYWMAGLMLATPSPLVESRVIEEECVEERHQRRIFYSPENARAYLEQLRWPFGPECPHCGSVAGHYALHGSGHRAGLWKCKSCREQFSVTLGTVFENSKIGLHLWLRAIHLLSSSHDLSIRELQNNLGVSYKTAWFMTQRLREAMSATPPEEA